MSFSKLLTMGTLSTIIFSGGVTALADEARSVTTEGNIQFVPNSEDTIIVVPPENEPDVEIEPEVPGTTGPLSIVKAVTMNFGIQAISNEDKTSNMIAEMQQRAGTAGEENKVPFVSFAQVSDTRGNNAGWDLSLSVSDFKSDSQNDILKGAIIVLKNPRIEYSGNNQELAPSFSSDRVELTRENGPIPIMSASQGKGAGRSSIVWGDQENLNKQFEDKNEVIENDSIQLVVPGNTAKDQAAYTATLTWGLSALPGAGAGAEEDSM